LDEKKKKILVVDDDPQIRKIVKLTLSSPDIDVRLAASGTEAISMVDEYAPDLILLDIMMPGMNGYEVHDHLKSRFKTRQIPIIFLTARREVDEKVNGLNLGVDDYITKPFVSRELRARVDNVLSKSTHLRTLSPLTGLPGSVAIHKETTKRIVEEKPHVWIYVDIDNFKKYNDHYGFIQGDEVIKLVADLLGDAIEQKGDGTEFLGHVGGDDFLLITTEKFVEPITEYILQNIKIRSPRVFPKEDRDVGFYVQMKRNNVTDRVPTELFLTMAVITNEDNEFNHPAQLSSVAAQVKEYGKSLDGSVVVYNRRRSSGPDPER